MNLVIDLFVHLSNWMRTYLYEITLALVATVAVIYSNEINRAIRKHIHRLHFAWRTMIFVVVCAVGYGGAIVLTTSFLVKVFRGLDRLVLAPVIVGCFVVVGILAERHKQI